MNHVYLVLCTFGANAWEPYGVFDDLEQVKAALVDGCGVEILSEKDTTVYKVPVGSLGHWADGECMDDDVWNRGG